MSTSLRLRNAAALLVLGVVLFEATAADRSKHKGIGFCNLLWPHLEHQFPVHKIRMPVDHFHNESRYEPHSDQYFDNHFWFNDTYYRPGGPIIIQNGGEIYGPTSLPDLQIGLLHELAKATNGLAVLLEHRYYGHSFPVPLHNTSDYRFLTVEQAMADQAYFAQNVVFPGKEHLNLTAPHTPWFAIGCSYPGALTAFERIQYPDLFWAAIASSAVTAPVVNDWEYYNVVREYSPQQCVDNMGKIINVVDNILQGGNATQISRLKDFVYPAPNQSNAEFASGVVFGYGLQSASWLPCLNAEANPSFCTTLAASTVLYPKAQALNETVKAIIADGGWANESETLTTAFLNWKGYEYGWHKEKSKRSTEDIASLPQIELKDLTWTYQTCTELGGFLTAHDAPADTLPVVSRFVDLEYALRVCRSPLNITELPDVSRVLKYGGHNLSYPRLMLVGGEADPWRPETPLAARDTPTRLNYSSTPDEPWWLIPGATHCWDQTGVFDSQERPGIPPEKIKAVHDFEKEAFQRWLKEWHDAHPNYSPYI